MMDWFLLVGVITHFWLLLLGGAGGNFEVVISVIEECWRDIWYSTVPRTCIDTQSYPCPPFKRRRAWDRFYNPIQNHHQFRPLSSMTMPYSTNIDENCSTCWIPPQNHCVQWSIRSFLMDDRYGATNMWISFVADGCCWNYTQSNTPLFSSWWLSPSLLSESS